MKNKFCYHIFPFWNTNHYDYEKWLSIVQLLKIKPEQVFNNTPNLFEVKQVVENISITFNKF